MTGFTSFGAGVSTLPVRYFSHGEVTVLTLAKC
jgi:predicted MPP superfamily phosphohydrolase